MSGDSTKQSWAFQAVVAHSLHYVDSRRMGVQTTRYTPKRGWLKTLIAERHEVETFDSRGVTFSGSSSPIRSEDFAARVPSVWTPQPL
ncbi:hypothetical protein NEUTE2DRAFT_93187 [Neurospora tetrasperma FGSC 2509]|nr:hypothetical protein NEUTE2DRAFT_93187 [Neurospora tetrasperma FGSC 2509]